MTITDGELLKQIKMGIANPKELARYLLNNYSAPMLADALAEELIANQGASKPIVVTKAEFEAHFRIQGYKFQDGQWIPETRGKGNRKE